MHVPHPGVAHMRKSHKANGLTTLFRGHIMHCAPPLVINEEEIGEGFEILDRCFNDLDEFVMNQD